MASYYTRKDSPYYWVRRKDADGVWRSAATRIRHGEKGSLRKISQHVAELQKDEKILENEGGESLLSNWVTRFFEKHCISPKTYVRYLNAWAHLSMYFKLNKAFHPGDVTYKLAMEYMSWRTDKTRAAKEKRRTCAKNTAINELKVLSLVLNEAVRRGHIYANPVQQMGLRKDKPAEKREITKEEETLIMELLKEKKKPQWMMDSFVIALKQGCRLSEVQVPLKNIDFEHGIVCFHTKGGKLHNAPLHAAVRVIAERRKAEGFATLCDLPGKASPIWSAFFDSVGMPEVTFHCLRVTVVTRLARLGYSEAQTMQYVGHASEIVHAIYRKLKAQDVRHLGEAL